MTSKKLCKKVLGKLIWGSVKLQTVEKYLEIITKPKVFLS